MTLGPDRGNGWSGCRAGQQDPQRDKPREYPRRAAHARRALHQSEDGSFAGSDYSANVASRVPTRSLNEAA